MWSVDLIYKGAMNKMSLSFRVDSRIVDALKKLAETENRSLSNYVITLIMKHLEEKGIDWKEPLKKAKE